MCNVVFLRIKIHDSNLNIQKKYLNITIIEKI